MATPTSEKVRESHVNECTFNFAAADMYDNGDDNEFLLRSHLREVLSEYIYTHIAIDHEQYTQAVVSEVRFAVKVTQTQHALMSGT